MDTDFEEDSTFRLGGNAKWMAVRIPQDSEAAQPQIQGTTLRKERHCFHPPAEFDTVGRFVAQDAAKF
jgi:hypothetical protein